MTVVWLDWIKAWGISRERYLGSSIVGDDDVLETGGSHSSLQFAKRNGHFGVLSENEIATGGQPFKALNVDQEFAAKERLAGAETIRSGRKGFAVVNDDGTSFGYDNIGFGTIVRVNSD